MDTRLVTITATRVFTGQILVEIPGFCQDVRLCGIIRHGGATARHLAAKIRFDRLNGTGLASCMARSHETPDRSIPTIPLAVLQSALRKDGLMF